MCGLRFRPLLGFSLWALVWIGSAETWAAPPELFVFDPAGKPARDQAFELLTDAQFDQVESSMDRALQYLSRQQRRDGSFPAVSRAQPAISGLCVMAFLSRGHTPGRGPYGDNLLRAVEFILACQQSDGLLAQIPPEEEYVLKGSSHTAPYNHSIGLLTLAEVYGMLDASQEARLQPAIAQAIQYTSNTQVLAAQSADDAGGWGYTPPYLGNHLTDLSVVSWQIMGLRASKNAGFAVSADVIDKAMAYVERRYDATTGGFEYCESQPGPRISMTGVGILMLTLGGRHDSNTISAAGDWLLAHPWVYDPLPDGDSSEYAAYYVSQAALQLGPSYWPRIYPDILTTLIKNQQNDGSWPASAHALVFGKPYTTAMHVLTLGAPLQLLPIYQR